ncbi:MAG TPA: RNA polymerase sigma factor [Steroidobacteraceae bacterium]|nr:RNA polymerase sigma factor [Steroidobacteraceae bacterium]
MISGGSQSASDLAGTAFRDHAGELHRFLARRVAKAQDADDLAQEVFARLLRVRNADLVRNPLSYLLGIATHVVREFRQRRLHERVLFDSDLADDLADHTEGAPEESFAAQLELRERLDRALKQLPPAHQLVLLLVKRDGLSYTEAARASGLSVHTIEKYVVEARARLRTILAEVP